MPLSADDDSIVADHRLPNISVAIARALPTLLSGGR